MEPNLIITIILSIFSCFSPCPMIRSSFSDRKQIQVDVSTENPYPLISDIPLPEGYWRIPVVEHSFANWLRKFHLKKSKTVYLYNGKPKANQMAQFAVLDISTGKKDLQQCADAIMRLRAEFLFSQKRYAEICFRDNGNNIYRLQTAGNRMAFENYLDRVFTYCGTLSLERQLKRLTTVDPTIGDILIQGGSPGHAMILVDMATNKTGKKIYLLAQSYMPAQDIHIVINPDNSLISPWYELSHNPVYTPEWTFQSDKFKTW